MKAKNIFIAAMALAAISALPSCTEEVGTLAPELPEEVIPENLVEMTFTASQDAADRKSTFDGKKINWELTDHVAVYDGTAKRDFSVVEISAEGVATLKGYVIESAEEFYAVYPYSAAGEDLPQQDKVSVNLPAVQTAGQDRNYDSAALVCVGKAVSGSFSLKNAVSFLKINIPEDVEKVSLKGFGYENISGVATVALTGEVSEGSSASVVYKPAEGIFTPGEYYIALLPTTFEAGFKVVYSKAGEFSVVKNMSEVTFPVNGGLDATDSPETFSWLANPIMTEEQLLAYVSNQEAYASEPAKIGGDIALTMPWTPVVLDGILDGQGHTVSGLNVVSDKDAAGMFSLISADAALKNITVEGSIELNSAEKTSYAGLAAQSQGSIYKVISNVNVSATSTGTTRCYAGGVAGMVSGGSIVECENNGNVTFEASASPSFMGGLVGIMTQDGLVQDCINTGVITSNSDKVEGLGGIVGIQQGGDVKSCVNKGTIDPKAGASNTYVGGIVGFVQNQSRKLMHLSDCVNDGILQVAPCVKGVGGICGVIHRYCNAPTDITGCVNNVAVKAETSTTPFYIGGIAGRIVNPGKVESAGDFVNSIKNCKNTGDVSAVFPRTVVTVCAIGGIIGNTLGQVVMENNENSAKSVLLSHKKANSTDGSALGGIVGLADASAMTFTRNVNNSAVHYETENNETPTGGLIGYVACEIDSKENINFGDVSVTSTYSGTSNVDNIYAGGLVGFLYMAETETASFTADKSFGHISSTKRSGIFAGVSRYNNTGRIIFKDCVAGGRLTSPRSGYDLELNADNFDDKLGLTEGDYLISYRKNTTPYTCEGTVFGVASDYR